MQLIEPSPVSQEWKGKQKEYTGLKTSKAISYFTHNQ